jgi:DNA helicase-2/ATP-dependent DNA helicase PcrA
MLKELEPAYRGFDVLEEAARVAYVSKPYTYWHKLKLNVLEDNAGIKRYTTITRFVDSIDIALNEGVDLQKLGQLDPDLATSIAAYCELLQTDRYLDFSTMIHELVILLERNKQVLKQLHDRVHYVVVDEYQDVNALQERLIHLMAGPHARITVVGDDDQSIYGWRGAVVDNIINFSKRYPSVKTVHLEQNFRSTEGIVPLANAYIGRNTERLDKRMLTVEGKKSKYHKQDIQYQHFEDEDEQFDFITAKIRELLESDFPAKDGSSYGLSLGDMAIIVRANADIQRLLPRLDEAGIEYVVDSGATIFNQAVVAITHRMLDYIFALDDI